MPAASWLTVELTVPAAAAQAVEAALLELGALSVSLGDPGAEPILEPGPGATPLWPLVQLTALLPPETAAQEVQLRLRPLLTEEVDVRFSTLAERDWVREFREQLAPRRFGSRLWICPAGTPCPDPAGVAVTLEPGLAFGSGSHPSTALCLQWLAALPLAGLSVLDYGCGSGVLAIAALALGARSATALDIDPQALLAARQNAERNGVAERLRLALPTQLPRERDHDVVLANILADTLIGLAPTLQGHCRAGARVALSGILATQTSLVRRGCRPWLDLHPSGESAGWALLAGTPVIGR